MYGHVFIFWTLQLKLIKIGIVVSDVVSVIESTILSEMQWDKIIEHVISPAEHCVNAIVDEPKKIQQSCNSRTSLVSTQRTAEPYVKFKKLLMETTYLLLRDSNEKASCESTELTNLTIEFAPAEFNEAQEPPPIP